MPDPLFRFRSVGIAVAVSSLWGTPIAAQPARRNVPDLLLVGGKVFTSDTARPWAEAVAIRGERILAVGTNAEIQALASPTSRVIDVGGRVVVPGFNDAHDHISGGSPGISIAMGGAMADPSARAILDSLGPAAARAPAGTWIRADLWLTALNDTALRRAALDRVAPRHPVMLAMPTGHGVILNSAGMRALDIRDSAADPLGGWYERDSNGRLTGRLDEYAGWSAIRRLRMTQPDSTIVAGLRQYADRELRLGITSVQNMAHSMDAPTTLRTLRKARLPLRVRVFKFSVPTSTSLGVGAWAAVPTQPAPLLTVGGRKWILDGTPVEQFALMRKPYDGRPSWHGRLNFPVDSMRAMLAAGLTSGEPLALHISGDSTALVVLSLMESLAPDSVWRRHRVRMEHGGGSVTPDMWARVQAKGIVIVNNLQLLPPPPISRAIPKVPLAAAISETIPMALGSDGEPRSPFIGMYYALSFPFEPQVSRELLVRAHTWGSAYAEFEERDKGTLAAGKLADIAVLSHDIFTVPLEDLPKTESLLTIVGGKVVWDAKALGGVATRAASLAFTHVTVIDVAGGRPQPDMTVLIAGNRISAVARSGAVAVPAGARVIDATGKYLIPGLWDMHVHSAAAAEREFPVYLALGVTGVRNMHTTVDTALALTGAIKRRLAANTLLGPRFVSNGPIVDGPRPAQRGSVAIASPDAARRAVDSLAAGGAEFIKVYNLLPRASYLAVVEQAKRHKIPVVGHVPFELRAEEVADAGQRSVEHLDGLDFACSTRNDSLRANLLARPSRELWQRTQFALVRTWSAEACGPAVEAYRRNGTWQVPTLAVGWAIAAADSVLADSVSMAVVPPATRAAWHALVGEMPEAERGKERDDFAQAIETTRLLHRAGVPILAGTDVGNPLLVPGYSLHRELRLLVRAGLTPLEALQTATLNPARFQGATSSLGAVAPGKLADLVLLDADPLADIANTQRIRAVVTNGRLLDRPALDAMLRQAPGQPARE